MRPMRPNDFQQLADHLCGAACVRILLDHFDLDVPSERKLSSLLMASVEKGIEPVRIETFLMSRGLECEYVENETFARLVKRSQKWIPIVVWADWGGHYCLIVDIDVNKNSKNSHFSGGTITLADPAESYEHRLDAEPGFLVISVDRFKSMWFTPFTKHKQEVIYVQGERLPVDKTNFKLEAFKHRIKGD